MPFSNNWNLFVEVSKIKPVISVIVPVYNVENYITRCIDSILAQSFTDFELLLINDGSTDKSGEICDNYLTKDCRVRVIHLNNGGVSKARNKGIELAEGDYLMFCDSDDYVETDWCSQLYETIRLKGNVLPVSGIRTVYNIVGDQREETIKAFSKELSLSKGRYFETYKKGLSGSLCCKIYARRIITENNINFDESVNRGEDLLFNLSYLNFMDAIITVPSISYNYIHSNQNSLMNQYRKDLFDVSVILYEAWQKYFKLHNVDKNEIEEFSTFYYLEFLNILSNTFNKSNQENIVKKLYFNNKVINSKVFIECLANADLSNEDSRYIRLLEMKNYYLVWLVEQVIRTKNFLSGKTERASLKA